MRASDVIYVEIFLTYVQTVFPCLALEPGDEAICIHDLILSKVIAIKINKPSLTHFRSKADPVQSSISINLHVE